MGFACACWLHYWPSLSSVAAVSGIVGGAVAVVVEGTSGDGTLDGWTADDGTNWDGCGQRGGANVDDFGNDFSQSTTNKNVTKME